METVEGLIGEGRGGDAVARLADLSATGDANATNRLATMTALGAWTPKDWPRALGLLALAADQGSVDAQGQIAVFTGGGTMPGVDDLMRLPPRQALCERPRVRRLDGFISPATCDWLVQRAEGRLVRAQTLERGADRVERPQDHPNRTNSAFVFPPFEGGVVLAVIGERIGAVVQVPPVVFEPTQIFHYAVGQEFRPHTDYFTHDGGSQRIATFLIYLNDGFVGGETAFLRAALKVRPAKGGAVYFANVDMAGEPDPLSLHAGLPPTSGEKWLLSQWIRDRPYVG